MVLEPMDGVFERLWFEPARAPLRTASARDQMGAFEHLQMFRDGGTSHIERSRQVFDGSLTVSEFGKNRSAGRIRQCGERGAEMVA